MKKELRLFLLTSVCALSLLRESQDVYAKPISIGCTVEDTTDAVIYRNPKLKKYAIKYERNGFSDWELIDTTSSTKVELEGVYDKIVHEIIQANNGTTYLVLRETGAAGLKDYLFNLDTLSFEELDYITINSLNDKKNNYAVVQKEDSYGLLNLNTLNEDISYNKIFELFYDDLVSVDSIEGHGLFNVDTLNEDVPCGKYKSFFMLFRIDEDVYTLVLNNNDKWGILDLNSLEEVVSCENANIDPIYDEQFFCVGFKAIRDDGMVIEYSASDLKLQQLQNKNSLVLH